MILPSVPAARFTLVTGPAQPPGRALAHDPRHRLLAAPLVPAASSSLSLHRMRGEGWGEGLRAAALEAPPLIRPAATFSPPPWKGEGRAAAFPWHSTDSDWEMASDFPRPLRGWAARVKLRFTRALSLAGRRLEIPPGRSEKRGGSGKPMTPGPLHNLSKHVSSLIP